MTGMDGFWIVLGSIAALVLICSLEACRTYRECRHYGMDRARCVAIVTHTE